VTSEALRAALRALPDPVSARIRHRTGRYAPWEDGTAPQGPPCPPGMTTGPPDFVGVGVPKAGTSWWFRLIEAHPDVASPPQKELNFFNRIFFRRERAGGISDDDLRAYHSFFPRPPGSVTGEWTPSYLFSYRLPPILRRAAPRAKLLVLLRDPVDRYQSDISRRMPHRRLRNVRYKGLARGIYTPELAPWEATYAPEEMLMLQYEACCRDPATHLAATYRFLGLDDSFRPARLGALVNETKAKRAVTPGFERLLVELYEPDVVALARRYPQIDLTLWPHFRHLAEPRSAAVE
jgi:hypothetical protein